MKFWRRKRSKENDSSPVVSVTIPDNVEPGEEFQIDVNSRTVRVRCPPNSRPGDSIQIKVPANIESPPQSEDTTSKSDFTEIFEVEVPSGVQPGQSFALFAKGVRVLVTCPKDGYPGARIRFKLHSALTQKPETTNEMAEIKLKYNKDGWQRVIRSDMKFQWVRVDDNGEVESIFRFDIEKSAYVRKFNLLAKEDKRIGAGILTLIPATEAMVDSNIKFRDNRDLVTYSHIVTNQAKSFAEKSEWFYGICHEHLFIDWSQGIIALNIRRQFLLGDSVDAVMSLSRTDLRKEWRFQLIGESGIDVGGPTREWFQLVTEAIFDPDFGLWKSSAANQMCMEINPASEFFYEDYLVYYRFLGRLMGRALFDRQLISGHMVQFLYKHLLGWPITFADLKQVDEDVYRNLRQIETMVGDGDGDDINDILCLDFTTTKEILDRKEVVELVEGGADVEVTNDNYHQYLEAILKYRMLECVRFQMNELLLEFFDIIPEPLLTIFDFQELELLMCGLPTIDMDDWRANTEYSGKYNAIGSDHEVCQWFWEVVTEFDQEMRARLLQFVTGTSGVPARGFGVLQSNGGNIRKFTIHGITVGECFYPRSHTCFNRIDLPLYESKKELSERLKFSVTMASTGFGIE